MAHRNFDRSSLSRRGLLRGGAFLGAGAFLSAVPAARMALAHDPAVVPSWPIVRAMVENYVAEGKVANMLAVMGWGQGEPEVIGKGVLTLGKPALADRDSLYRIYSMTKPVTGMATSILIDSGDLGLDQPLHEILPAYRNMRVQTVYDGSIEDTVAAERDITIRHLLTHTAGLGYGVIQKGPIREAYEERGLIPGQISRIPIPGLSRAKPVDSLEAFADGLAEMPLVYQPGTKWSYSVSLDLLGRVIEVVSGQSFDSFLAEQIFAPAGMDSTWFTVPDSEKDRLTTNYGVLGGNLLPIDIASNSVYLDEPAFPFGGAGLVSSPRDYDRFLQMVVGYGAVDGKRVMSESAVALATSNLMPNGLTMDFGPSISGGFGAGGVVGLGEFEGTYGWGGAAGTAALVDMKRGLRASMYTQYMPSEAWGAQTEFRQAVAADLVAAATGMIRPDVVNAVAAGDAN